MMSQSSLILRRPSGYPSSRIDVLTGDISTANSGGAAAAIRDRIVSRRVGCGCVITVVAGVFSTYYLGRLWTENSDFALVVTALVGLGLFFASWLRGYHLLTGFAGLSVVLVGIGAAPLVYRVLYPDQDLLFLGWAMRSWWFSVSLTVGGGALLAFLISRIRETISTPEALYAIQVAAATKAVSADEHGRFVSAALEFLVACAKAGAWPVDGALIQGDSRFAAREPDEALLTSLVVLVRPQEGDVGEVQWQPLGDPPWLHTPSRWVSTFPNSGPISVGELLVEPGALGNDM